MRIGINRGIYFDLQVVFLFIVKSRKEVLWSLLFIGAGLLVGATLGINPILKTFGLVAQNREICVVVDAGHGLPDGGAVGIGGTVEQKINLGVSKKVEEVLSGKGIKVIMTRTDDNCLSEQTEGKSLREMKKEDMNKRLKIIKQSNADLFVSIHMNQFPKPQVNGLRLFYDKSHPETKELAELMQERMSEVTGAKMYAVKTADQSLFLMKNPPVPALLVECGFISNPDEEKKLNDEDYQARLAWAIAEAVEIYLNAK